MRETGSGSLVKRDHVQPYPRCGRSPDAVTRSAIRPPARLDRLDLTLQFGETQLQLGPDAGGWLDEGRAGGRFRRMRPDVVEQREQPSTGQLRLGNAEGMAVFKSIAAAFAVT